MEDILVDLQRIAKEKKDALNEVMLQRMAMERRLQDEARVKVSEAYGAAENKASEELAKATRILRLEIERRAVEAAAAKIPYPVGTRMVLWAASKYTMGKYTATTTRGVLEIFKAGDEYPSNQRWSRPAPGDVVVRTLTKDGNPGKKAERLSASPYGSKWVPEGQELKQA